MAENSERSEKYKEENNSLHFNSLKHILSNFWIYDSSSLFLPPSLPPFLPFLYISNGVRLFSIYNFECVFFRRNYLCLLFKVLFTSLLNVEITCWSRDRGR